MERIEKKEKQTFHFICFFELKVMSDCKSIPKYSPISFFFGDSVLAGTKSGIFIECTSSSFVVSILTALSISLLPTVGGFNNHQKIFNKFQFFKKLFMKSFDIEMHDIKMNRSNDC